MMQRVWSFFLPPWSHSTFSLFLKSRQMSMQGVFAMDKPCRWLTLALSHGSQCKIFTKQISGKSCSPLNNCSLTFSAIMSFVLLSLTIFLLHYLLLPKEWQFNRHFQWYRSLNEAVSYLTDHRVSLSWQPLQCGVMFFSGRIHLPT